MAHWTFYLPGVLMNLGLYTVLSQVLQMILSTQQPLGNILHWNQKRMCEKTVLFSVFSQLNANENRDFYLSTWDILGGFLFFADSTDQTGFVGSNLSNLFVEVFWWKLFSCMETTKCVANLYAGELSGEKTLNQSL